jgi:hypothetical protein
VDRVNHVGMMESHHPLIFAVLLALALSAITAIALLNAVTTTLVVRVPK